MIRHILPAALFAGLALPGLLLSGTASADAWFGVGVGSVRFESDLGDLGLLPQIQGDVDAIDPDFGSSDVSFQVVAGYRFNRWIGVELGYVDLGEAEQFYALPELCEVPRGCQSREWAATVEPWAWQGWLVGFYPVSERVELYAKAGALFWDADYKGIEPNAAIVPNNPELPARNEVVKFDDDGTDVAFALGLDLKTPSAISLRTEFAWYDLDDTDAAWTLSATAIYNF